ncbi:hypothetical protein FDF26_11350 [Clostridium botulinum]|uniref:DUF6751 family protein n=1 Tax=unclassified Clostridium TaxID=2614128 RepID=UPI0013F83D22|nr:MULTISPECIES: DUF6751 family protein [unclassified Clostridium]NFR85808.1 hypothetical protein [Clostridium botulinum]NFR91442.1 hypothetical protein [Clostridium botulinum]NFT07651.1 hypothetical protein [Clostridium botulinum]NFU00123.1 hypothetical protein [Clostridium botulinum]
MRTNTIATLYNHYTDKETERVLYKRTVITSVNWQGEQKTAVIDKGLISANQIDILIPFNSDFEGKEYIGPKEYRRLVDEDKDKYFTFDNDDYIVKGEIDNSITVDTLKKSYDNVGTIISTLTCDKGSQSIRHYEIGAK